MCPDSVSGKKEVEENLKKLHILPFTSDHIEEALSIERESFPTPWSFEAFKGELDLKNSGGLVAILETGQIERLVGYILGRWVRDEMEVINLAVRPGYRRKGIASRLLLDFIGLFKSKGIAKVFLEVREKNIAAIRLYKKFGFVEAGTRKGYYVDTGEDALVMRLDIFKQKQQGSNE